MAASAGFFALDAATGELVWQLPVGTVHSAPAVVGTSVLLLSGDGVMYAFDALDAGAAEPGRTGAGAYVSPIVFSSEVDVHERPVDANTTFTDISGLYAGLDLVGMADGTPYQISWTHDGDVFGVLDETWSENSAGRYLWGDELKDGVIPAGEWEIVVTVESMGRWSAAPRPSFVHRRRGSGEVHNDTRLDAPELIGYLHPASFGPIP